MTTAQKILRLLKDLRLDQKSTAKAVGVAYPTFRSYLRNVSPSVPGVDIAFSIARELKVPMEWLFDDDQDWPPPEPHSPANLGPQELVAELARRRELIRKDMRSIAADFQDDLLVHLDQISAPGYQFPGGQQDELRIWLDDLIMYSVLENQLEWLDPDIVHPTTKLPKLNELLEGYDHLSARFNTVRNKHRTGILTSPIAAQRSDKRCEVPRYDRDGGTFPAQPHPPRSRSRSTPKRRGTGEKPTPPKPKKPKPRTTGKKSAPAKPQRPKRPPRS